MKIVPRTLGACCSVGVLLVTLAASVSAQRHDTAPQIVLPPGVRAAAETITADQLREHLAFIASDDLLGRGTPSAGLDLAAKYLAKHLAPVIPAGDRGEYFQHISLTSHHVDRNQAYAELGRRRFHFPDLFGAGIRRPFAGRTSARGPLVYVGHGWVSGSLGIDPYAGFDVRGNLVVIVRPRPAREAADWVPPWTAARAQGAVGIVYLPTSQEIATWSSGRAQRMNVSTLSGARIAEDPEFDDELPSITASLELASTIFADERQSAQDVIERASGAVPVPPFALNSNKVLAFDLALTSEPSGTQNVVAIVEGRDPALNHEYVIVGAHYDHIGTGPPVNGDSIFNGADDNGSGTVALLTMARAFAAAERPKRSLLFVWFAGEEIFDHLGSFYFVGHPTVPLDRMAAYVNLDMIGRNDAGGPVLFSSNSHELEALVEQVNRNYLDLPIQAKPLRGGSDHTSFRTGDRVVLVFGGVIHSDYHRVTDSADKIDYPYLQNLTRTIFGTVWAMAEASERPRAGR